MAKNDTNKKYKKLKEDYEKSKTELEEIKNSRIYILARKMPEKLSKWLLSRKIDKKIIDNKEINNNYSLTEIKEKQLSNENNKSAAKEKIKIILINLKKYIINIINKIIIFYKDLMEKCIQKYNKIYLDKKSKISLLKTEIISEESNIKNEEITIFLIIEEELKERIVTIYNLLHQSYINYNIIIVNLSGKNIDFKEYLNIDSRIKVRRFENKECIFTYINDEVNSSYITITNNIDGFKWNIKRIIKVLNRGYLIKLVDGLKCNKYLISFKKDNLEKIHEYIDDNSYIEL